MNKALKYFPFVFFLFICVIFFFKVFAGYSIQGVDTGLWSPLDWKQNALHTPYAWNSLFWLGMSQGTYNFSVYWVISQLFPLWLVLPATYFFSIILGLVFFYFLTKKLGISLWGRIFGSVCYAFMPSIVTLIYSGHIQVIELLPYIPLIFWCIEEIFDTEGTFFGRKLIFFGAIFMAWGLMVSLDVQRGLYVTFAAVIYIFYLTLKKIKEKNFLSIIKSTILWKNILLLFITGILSLCVFSLSFYTWIEPLRGRIALQNKANQKSEAEKFDFASSWSFHPFELVDSVAFGFHGMISGDEKAPYWGEKPFAGNSEAIGFFTVLFGLIGIVLTYKKNYKSKFFFWSFLVLLLLSFGRYWPGKPFFWLFYKLPLMANFRAPAKFLCVGIFFFAILASFGFDHLFNIIEERLKEKKRFLDNLLKILLSFLIIFVFLLFLVMIASSDIASSIAQKLNNNYTLSNAAVKNIIIGLLRGFLFNLLSIVLIFIALRLDANKKGISLISKISFIVLAIIDLFSIDWFYLSKSYVKINDFYKGDEIVDFLKRERAKDVFRVATSAFLPTKDGTRWLPTTRLKGYYLTYFFPFYSIETLDIPAISTVFEEYENFFSSVLLSQFKGDVKTYTDLLALNSRLFELGNVKYLLFDLPPEYLSNESFIYTNTLKAIDGKPVYIYYNKNYLPRVSFYTGFVVVTNEREALNYLSFADFNFRKNIVLQAENFGDKKSDKERLELPVEEYKNWKYKLDINIPESGFVVFSSKFDRNWKATVDEKPVPTYPVNYLLTGVFVPAGRHTLEFFYRPPMIFYYITILTLMSGVLIIFFGLIKMYFVKIKVKS